MTEKNLMKWTIDNFAQRLRRTKLKTSWSSPIFHLKPSHYSSLHVRMIFGPLDNYAASLELTTMDSYTIPCWRFDVEIWMESSSGHRSVLKKSNALFRSHNFSNIASIVHFNDSEINEFENEDTVFIYCKTPHDVSVPRTILTQWIEKRWDVIVVEDEYDEPKPLDWKKDYLDVEDYLSELFVTLTEYDGNYPVDLEYKLWVEDSDGAKSCMKDDHILFFANHNQERFYCQDYFRNVVVELNEDPIFLCFNARLWIDIDKEMPTVEIDHIKMYNDENFADLEIRVGQVNFKASKFIVCSQSGAFYRMFTNAMKERETGIVQIDNFDVQLVEKMLLYLYSGKVNDLSSCSLSLLNIAEHFEINGLINLCTKSILMNLNMDNFFRVYPFVIQVGRNKRLKLYVLEYAKCHRQEICRHPHLKEFISHNQDAANELMHLFNAYIDAHFTLSLLLQQIELQ
ncbi:hypothetical protein M3Y94_00377000 [Aphelenchoides besseyi]|nr:hypothetical protein M3Y94_00377000 [Aphelenchoides besseyi]KAI6235120.1 Speckle-type POZ protein [Aphelenchoides besseyi]